MQSEASHNGHKAIPLTMHQSASVHKFSVQHWHLPTSHPHILCILQTHMMRCTARSPAAMNSLQTATEHPRHSYSFACVSPWIWCAKHVWCWHDSSSAMTRLLRFPVHVYTPLLFPATRILRTGDSPFFSGEENLAPRRVCIFAFSQPTLCCVVSVTLHTHPLLFYTDL